MKAEDLVSKIKKVAQKLTLDVAQLGVKSERWVVEGDVGLTDAQLLPYAARRIEIAERANKGEPEAKRRGLIAIESGGKILRWKPGTVLTYCVFRPTFNSDAEHAAAVRSMELAAADWEGICGVKFEYVPGLDNKADLKLGDVAFPVVRQNGGGNTIAMAFFPNSPLDERLVFVFDGFYASAPGSFDPNGVLRHELGHALGFRHEHIVPEAPDFFSPEDTDHIHRLTDYDPQSVMHYVGPGVGNPKLEFTASDRSGAKDVYGRPYAHFDDV
jgi:hypothetical protein